ncbi:BlaI/MecI/CopY family transcriptional regulator [Streptomyces sp. NPDC015350]|uniref:BlaI/MecI/CopY family transcriptional regulator n=1 Tax=Streptomyces sp. NPDC015350 TaxID=3364955 RepID=UPI0037001C0E
MADEPEKTPIQDKYAQQYAADLAANRGEQGDITAQISVLQKRLEQLKVEEGWLAQAQGSLPPAVTPGESGAGAAGQEPPVTVEEQRVPGDEAPAPAEAVLDTSRAVPAQREDAKNAKKTAAAKGRGASQKTAAKKAAETTGAEEPTKAAGRKTGGPMLTELVLAILLKSPGHPHTVRDVADTLDAEHSERAASFQTVRNTLERLVAKSRVERSRQKRSVMYVAFAGQDGATAADGVAGGESAESGKVPAKV